MLELQISNWKELEKVFDPAILNRATNRGISRGLMKTRTAIKERVRSRYVIKAGDIAKTVKLKKLSFNPAVYLLNYAGYRRSLRHYGAKAKVVQTAAGQRIGVTVRIRKDRGRKLVGKQSGLSAGFFGPGGYPAYARSTDKRKPIHKLTSLAVPQMVGTEYTVDFAHRIMVKEFPVEFNRAMDFYIGKLSGAIQ